MKANSGKNYEMGNFDVSNINPSHGRNKNET